MEILLFHQIFVKQIVQFSTTHSYQASYFAFKILEIFEYDIVYKISLFKNKLFYKKDPHIW